MEQLFQQLLILLDRGEKASLSTVLDHSGSIPSPANAKLLVSANGSSWGTIGGGKLEAEVYQAAKKAVAEECPKVSRFVLSSLDAGGEGMLCGGQATIYTEVVFPVPDEKEIFHTAIQALKSSHPVALATAVLSGISGKARSDLRMLFDRERVLAGSLLLPEWSEKVRGAAAALFDNEDPLYLELEGKPEGFPYLEGFLVEFLYPAPTLVIFGGGHIAVPLCRIGSMCGFRVMVVDDRPEFADPSRFPEAARTIVSDFKEVFDRLDIGPGHYLVSVTRGHMADRIVIRKAVELPAAYIGMIGSRRKIKLLWKDLEREGVDPEKLSRVHAPIGLDIQAETPEEIAVSIMAEIIMTRRSRKPVIKKEIISL
jgi:xanthine dehydrogenase accessory factor